MRIALYGRSDYVTLLRINNCFAYDAFTVNKVKKNFKRSDGVAIICQTEFAAFDSCVIIIISNVRILQCSKHMNKSTSLDANHHYNIYIFGPN